MMIKPHITLFFVLSVFLVLLCMAIVFPEDGIALSEDIKLTFISPSEIFSSNEDEYADISSIIKTSEALLDSTMDDIEADGFDTIRADAEILRQSITQIEFPRQDASILYPVFREMESAQRKNKVIRIMHYGDSQIETDRITSFMRNRLQRKFGGSGIGLVPIELPYPNKFSIIQENSDSWYSYVQYWKRDTTVLHQRYGIIGSFSMFSPRNKSPKDSSEYSASVTFTESPYAYNNTKTFEQCRVYYGQNKAPFSAKLYVSDSLVDSEMYPQTNELQKIQWSFRTPVSDIKLVFSGTSSPELYCIALDGLKGIAVDNVAMRGSSGLMFTQIDKSLLKEFFETLDVKLLLLQFGGNVVPNIREDYTYYENLFLAQLNLIKSVAPDMQIIVIGVADMSMKENNRYITYPNIEKIRNAMKRAAFKNGAGYWDMYKAMGGKNSMPSWVFANPPLAITDFVHFNPRGANLIANMFYNAFLYEYQKYRKQSENSVNKKNDEVEGQGT